MRIKIMLFLVSLWFTSCTLNPTIGNANEDVGVYIDGKQVKFNVAPVVSNGRTLVPLRGMFEELGAVVEWNNDDKKVLVTKDEIVLEMRLNNKVAIKNGNEVTLDEPFQILNNVSFIPLRFISENLGAFVLYEKEGNSIKIETTDFNYNTSFFDGYKAVVGLTTTKPTIDTEVVVKATVYDEEGNVVKPERSFILVQYEDPAWYLVNGYTSFKINNSKGYDEVILSVHYILADGKELNFNQAHLFDPQ